MTELYLEPSKVYDENPLGITELESDESMVTAFENLNIIYHGLITTTYRDYQKPTIQEALKSRVSELASVTNYSPESVYLAIDTLAQGTYSTENEFINVVKSVIQQILEWLSKVKNWIIQLIKKLMGTRTQQKAASTMTGETFKRAKKKYEKEKRDFPERIKIKVPGQCYVAFHSARHEPKAGYVYNTQGLKQAIEYIGKDIGRYLTALEEDVQQTIYGIETLTNDLTRNPNKIYKTPMIQIKEAKQIRALYHNNFKVIGFGLVARPLRNQNRHFNDKIVMADLVPSLGWSAVEGFDITIETDRFEEIRSLIDSETKEPLARIINVIETIEKSNAIKRLSELRKDQMSIIETGLRNNNGDESYTIQQQKEVLSRIEMTYELVNHLTDNAMFVSKFYTRYITILTRLMANAAMALDQK